MTRDISLGSNVLWTRCCRELFKSKYNCPTSRTELPLHANTRLSEEQLKLLSVKQLRSFLRTLGVAQNQINQCVEKGEMRRLCKDKRAHMDSQLRTKSSIIIPLVPHSCAAYMSFVCAKLDWKRNEILRSELCAHPFGMFFKNVQTERGVQIGRYDQCYHTTHKFHENGSMTSEVNLDSQERTWDFKPVENNPRSNRPPAFKHPASPWKTSEWGIEIQPFPILRVSRSVAWGWVLENEHVVMFQDVSHSSGVDEHFEKEGWSRLWIDYRYAQQEWVKTRNE
ncbi:hypothetical protein TrST_g12360 [Triparma strigata]|uniref:Uncharacterized protein n=1 Tax=Triparma strigata TaxID=1606541 RepID=A0A9W7F0P0_9STRA|nr:hypothetical protein TrST_g12360 [Triparma strigata]